MSLITRGTLPANYDDLRTSVSSSLLLPQPEPQYVFAQWAMAGRLSLAALNAGVGTAREYVAQVSNGMPIPDALDRMARVADMYPGFSQTIDSFGLGKGDTVKFQRPSFSTGGLTKAARELGTGSTISTTGLAISMEEIPVVLKEYHGPYAANGSGVQPFGIWDFDRRYRAAKVSIDSLVSLHLKRDYTKWLDTVIRDELLASQYVTYSGGLANAAAFVAGGGNGFNLEDVFRARQAISDREWMRFPNGRYVCLVPTVFNTHMVSDVDYRDLSSSHQDKNMLYGYIGSVQDVDFFECSTLKSYAPASSLEGSTVAAGVTLQEAIMVGPGALGFGTGGDGPEMRFSDATNYGTTTNVIWYALHAMQLLDERGVQRFVAQSA